jgi:hypothetical protein
MKSTGILGLLAGLALVATGCDRNEATSPTGAGSDTYSRSDQRETDRPNVTPSTDSRAATNAANPSYDADNTGRNVRDRDDAALTPGDQGETASDREITRQIRRSITSNDQLSSNAKNVKIITTSGKVTLRGPVKSEQEKQLIASVAQGVTGVSSLDNQIEVEQQTQQNQQNESK